MKVLVLGGYGLIGSSVVTALREAGHDVAGLGRSVAAARRRRPDVHWIAADLSTLTTPGNWKAIIDGFDAVVNCAGVLQESPRDDVAKIQRDAMIALFSACETAGVGKVVQISAVGAEPGAETRFMATKGQADDALKASSLDWTILRPALVISPTAYGATGMIRALAAVPLLVPLAGAGSEVRTVDVADVGAAVVACLAGDVPTRTDYDLAGEHPQTLADVVVAFRGWLGFPSAPVLRLPDWLGTVAFRFGDLLGALGWRTPMRSTAFREVSAGIRGDPAAWIAAGGRRPRTLQETLARIPSTVQERWYARMWLMRPLAIGTLSAFWVVSGLVGLISLSSAKDVLTDRGMADGTALIAVLAGVVIDLALGGAVLVRRLHTTALAGMILVTTLYLVAGSVIAPDLWLEPLGAFVKTVPAAVLALVLLAVSGER